MVQYLHFRILKWPLIHGDESPMTPRPGPKTMAPATHKVGSAPAIRARHMAAPWWCLRRRLGVVVFGG